MRIFHFRTAAFGKAARLISFHATKAAFGKRVRLIFLLEAGIVTCPAARPGEKRTLMLVSPHGVLNPGAYTHTSVALLDALLAVGIPAVEVHISDVDAREPFRQISYAGKACEKTIKDHGFNGYREAMEYLVEKYG